MANRLKVTDLDFDTIKTNLKTFLQQQSEFTDYNFEGSGLSVLLDLLAYNTHYNAYYLNMVANESFLDTALIRDSVVSHAKTLGYVPRSVTSSRAVIDFTVEGGTTTPETLTIPKGYVFRSNLLDNKSYNFVVLEDKTITKSNTQFLFEGLDIYEGQLVSYSFTQNDLNNPKQIFTLPDSNIDSTTITVRVSPSSSNTQSIVYNKTTNILDVDSTSEVFFVQEGKNGQYQIYFGNGVVGKKLEDGSIVTVTYLITSGAVANGIDGFIGSASIGGYSNFSVDVIDVASGGADRETIDSIKFSAISQFSTQNRLVTYKDYETYLLSNYPNINSISVWGGEENDPPVYGKVFISLKPRDNYFISETEKQRIIDEIIKPKSIIAVKAEILDPEFLYLILDVTAQYDSKKTIDTEETIKQKIRTAVINYKNLNLDKFDSKIVDSKLEAAIDAVDLNAIIGSDLTIKVQKRFEPTINQAKSYFVKFNVPLHRGTITNKMTSTEFDVLDFNGVRRTVVFEEIPQSSTGISSIDVTNPGSGYTIAPTVTITGDGIGARAEAIIVNGKIERIDITNRGVDYSRATVTISGGDGFGATASAIIDAKIGTIRTIYYDSNAERQIVDESAGEINYETGAITISDIRILSVNSTDGQIRLTIESQEGILESVRNTIITIDETDPISIVTTLDRI